MPPEPVESAGILVVEDQPDARDTLLMALPLFGFKRLFQAVDGQAGYECFRQHPEEIELVITDFDMPQLDGMEMTRRLARENRLPVGILMLTAIDKGSLEREFLEAGSASVLPLGLLRKPYSIAAVAQILKDAIPVVRARREARAPS